MAIAADRFGYCAIRIRESHAAPSLRLPFDQHRDPKTAPGGALNWHLDHFSYFLHGDHRNYLICYMPVRKPDAGLANVAIVADDVVARLDPDLHRSIQGRGALRFRCVEADTLDWFRLRFPGDAIAVGDWYAIEDLLAGLRQRLQIAAGRCRWARSASAGLDIGQFVRQAGSWRIMLDLVGIGLACSWCRCSP
ncbi:hypothetical protein NB693_23085 [Pantoea ananatis]|uniref:hypothetical protein n=1 Tax=Pantoea ananas TaxID=553 RepID=UPI00221F9800|nr:hypothetical protein [Pantoea ananatis]